MSQRVIILGAAGRMGQAACEAFLDAGWSVTAFGRRLADRLESREGLTRLEGDALDQDGLVKACSGHDVIFNALNPPYSHWSRVVPHFTANVIAAAKVSGARIAIPGNVYVYGQTMPPVLRDDTPFQPSNSKGRLRADMEATYRDAGVPTLILRCGDFIDTRVSGNWLESHMLAKIHKGEFMYPGPTDLMHAWAFLPDVARGFVALLDQPGALARFESIGFAGYALTGQDLINTVEQVEGRRPKLTGLPWPIIRLMGLFDGVMRGVVEMSYLWRTPHHIESERFQTLCPDFSVTPVTEAVRQSIAAVRES